jgi:hypothetical protein
MDERIWKLAQRHLGYTDDQVAVFQENPRNADV